MAVFEIPERTRPFALAGWPFGHPTMLAPMEGVTHPAFRAIVGERGGCGIVCTEFVRVSRAPLAPDALRRTVVKHPGIPLSVQVMGNEADKMAEAAEIVAEAGADVVDVNLGCPMPRVVRKGVGAAMLKDASLTYRVLSEMRKRTPSLLSAKIRAGFDDARDVIAIARAVEAAGIDYLVVHPRRRCDFYEGVSDWRIITTLKEQLRVPVVGNGDVWYAVDGLRMQRETGCDAVMIGRPALRNPWIFVQIADLHAGREPFAPTGDDVLDYLEVVRARYEQDYGHIGRGPIGKLKELVRYVLRALPERDDVTREAMREPDMQGLFRVLGRCLRGRPKDSIDLDAFGTLSLERSGSACKLTGT